MRVLYAGAYVSTCSCVCTCRGQSQRPAVFLYFSLPRCLETEYLTELDAHPFNSSRAGVQKCVATPSVLHKCYGLARRSSCSQSNHSSPLSHLPSPSVWSLMTGLCCLWFFLISFVSTPVRHFNFLPCHLGNSSLQCQEAILFPPDLSDGC